MAPRMLFSALVTASLSSPSIGFVPNPLLGRSSTDASVRRSPHLNMLPHVAQTASAASRQLLSGRKSSCREASVPGIGMTAVGEGSAIEAKARRWAEEGFPGCSIAVSEATRLSGLLAEVWETLADPSAVREDQPRVLFFPDCPAVARARGLQGLYEHLEVCQDACEQFGTAVSIVPHPKDGSTHAPTAALVVQTVAGAGGGDEFDFDPAWDGDWDIDRSMLDDDDVGMGGEGDGRDVDLEALSVVPGTDEEVTELTKSWVQAVITDMGVCPFSVDASRAGLPVGQVRYPVTRETTAEAIYREYWKEVELLVSELDEKSLSTTLLITPEFALNNAEAFEVIGQTLTQPLEALHMEDDIQLVFFHPQYAFRDGRNRIGSGGAANFARRSPFPMINILRTKQVRLGQKSIPTGLVYKQNEDVLEEVGAGHLQEMLERRDWAGLEGKKVDRRRVDYYETARKLQGVEISSPAATKTPEPQAQAPNEDTTSARTGARESLSEAAGSMETSFAQGFSVDDDGDGVGIGVGAQSREAQDSGGVAGSAVALPPGSMAGGAEHVGGGLASPAASSEGIADEDLRIVATALVKRLGSGVPLGNPPAFEEFSEAVERILRDTTAGAP